MLYVEKQRLLAETARDVAVLRETELGYYVEHIGAVQNMATLLAGFAFTAIVSLDVTSISRDSVLLLESSGAYTFDNASGMITPIPATASDGYQIWAFCAHVAQAILVVLCLGEMMHVMTETLVARQLGSRLALRGVDGSIISATRRLAASLANSTKRFFQGLQYFLLSVVFHALRGMHPALAAVVAVIILVYLRGQGSLVRQLAVDFELKSAVNTVFPEAGSPSDRGSPGKLKRAKSFDPAFALEQHPSIFGRVRRAGRVLGSIIGPVNHQLRVLYEQVDDVEGAPGLHSGHRKPTEATATLIHRVETDQFRNAARYEPSVHSSMDAVTHAAAAAQPPPVTRESNSSSFLTRLSNRLFPGLGADGPPFNLGTSQPAAPSGHGNQVAIQVQAEWESHA